MTMLSSIQTWFVVPLVKAVQELADCAYATADNPRSEALLLADGGAVRAEFDGKTYEWKLTYRGGPNRCDIMLTDVGSHWSLLLDWM